MTIYIMLPFTSVIYRPKPMENSAVLTEDYIEQFGSARFVYSPGTELIRKTANYERYRISWKYTRVRPEMLKLYREEEDE